MSVFRILGVILAPLGAIGSIFPHWAVPLTRAAEPTLDLFEAIERRVRAGMLLGLGLALIAVPSLRPWSTSIPTAIVYFAAGVLATRVLGLAMDGSVPKQWLLVAVETIVMTLAALWLWRAPTT